MNIISWLLGSVTVLFIGFNLAAGRIIPVLPLIVIAFFFLPPTRALLQNAIGRSVPIWVYPIVLITMTVAYFALLIYTVWMVADDVFLSEDVKTEMMAIYDEKLAEWSMPYETRMVDTSYGDVFVVISGDEALPPALLFHASAMSTWSWGANVEALNGQYRTYAIDTLGEANKSVLDDRNIIPSGGEDIAAFYAEVADALGVERAYVIGASYGGFIATTYALHYPERVERLALLGPMGMTPSTSQTAMRIMFVQFYPLEPIQSNTVRWALGEAPDVLAETEDWFRLVRGDPTSAYKQSGSLLPA